MDKTETSMEHQQYCAGVYLAKVASGEYDKGLDDLLIYVSMLNRASGLHYRNSDRKWHNFNLTSEQSDTLIERCNLIIAAFPELHDRVRFTPTNEQQWKTTADNILAQLHSVGLLETALGIK